MVRKWSPFPSTQYVAQWVGHRACVYAWDRDAVAQEIAAAGATPARCTVWAESFFRPPLQDAVRLSQMCDGVEGQVWRGGLLSATRWWPATPEPRDWSMFLRSAGVDLSQSGFEVPSAVPSELLIQPWTITAPPVTDLWSLLQNEHAAAVAATVVAVPFLYYLTQAVLLLIGTIRVEGAIADLSAANQSIRADRTVAFTNLETVESYLGLETYPAQFRTMKVVTDLLRDSKVTLSEWNYDSGNLQIVIQADRTLEAPFFIEIFEKSEHFSNVTGTVGNQQKELRLGMQIEPYQWPTS